MAYPYGDVTSGDHPDREPPVDDAHGQATVTGYDWRMRPVRVDVYARGVPEPTNRLTTTLTVLDHASRPRLVVMYGPDNAGGSLSLADGLDPSGFGVGTPLPMAAQYLSNGGLKPLSVSETIYAPDSSVVERREYDVTWTGGGEPPYHAEFTYTGQGGATVFRMSPGGMFCRH